MSAVKHFKAAEIIGYEIDPAYAQSLQRQIEKEQLQERVSIKNADFFSMDWLEETKRHDGQLLIIGNFPWVTNSAQGGIGGTNLPEKSNFQGHSGFDSISGKANFDISEWMTIEALRWLKGRTGALAMLVKTAVARKILAYANKQRIAVSESFIVKIDAKKYFNASVDACLLVIRINKNEECGFDYTVFENLKSFNGCRVGHRGGLPISDLAAYEKNNYLMGNSPQKWRSGLKHDASSIMEFTLTHDGFLNGLGEIVQLEDSYLFPLLKGSDVGSSKKWGEKYVLVTQRYVGQPTDPIKDTAPRTWDYLMRHASRMNSRGSVIYAKNPPFSIFGVGPYAFRPWRIAICGLYKSLNFKVVGPLKEKPVMFDDTVYYTSFETQEEADRVSKKLASSSAQEFLSSLIFWDDKRAVKSSILNLLDWSKIESPEKSNQVA